MAGGRRGWAPDSRRGPRTGRVLTGRGVSEAVPEPPGTLTAASGSWARRAHLPEPVQTPRMAGAAPRTRRLTGAAPRTGELLQN